MAMNEITHIDPYGGERDLTATNLKLMVSAAFLAQTAATSTFWTPPHLVEERDEAAMLRHRRSPRSSLTV